MLRAACFLLALSMVLPLGRDVYADEEGENAMPPRDQAASKEQFETGEVAREELRTADAADLYWKAVEADPLNYRAQVRMANARLALGDEAEDIRKDINYTYEEFPHLVDLKLHMLRLDEPEARLAALTKLAEKHADHANLDLELGRAHLALGQIDEALLKLEAARAKLPADRVDAWLLWIQALQKSPKRAEEVLPAVEKQVAAQPEFFTGWLIHARLLVAAGTHKEARASLKRVLNLRPTYVAAWMLESELAARADEEEAAISAIEKARRVAPENHDLLLAHAGLITRYKSGGEDWAKQAKALIDQVLDKDDENVRAFYARAWIEELLKEWKKAEDNYREVLIFEPRHTHAINSLGISQLKQGLLKDAQGQFRKVLDLDENFIDAMLNLGSTYDAQAKYQDAIDIYEKVLKNKAHKDNMRAIINCAFNYEALTNFNKAYKLLQRAEKLKPDDPEIKIWLGDNTFFRKKWTQAQKHYEESLDIDDNQFWAWRGLGLCLVERRKFKEAAEALEKAMALKADDAQVLYNLGSIYMSELEDLPRALELFKALEATGEADESITDTIEQLEADIERAKK